MSPTPLSITACLLAYLLGSISFAILVSACFGLKDPRAFGSKNPGATNVLRSGNKAAALLTLLGDAGKGWLAVFLATLYSLPHADIGLIALAVFLGHLYPVFLRFKGGKGVATAAGALLGLSPLLGGTAIATWIVVFCIGRYSSLAALCAAMLAALLATMIWGMDAWSLIVIVMATFLVFRHWANIGRLFAGTEPKFNVRK